MTGSPQVGFQLRAPWWARESVRARRAWSPVIQMYAGSDFVDQVRADVTVSLRSDETDRWGYPVPVTLTDALRGRERLSTHRIVRSNIRKLYQPSHDRFYVLAVEVLCDRPGLPLAGMHDDIEVGFVLRRQVLEFGSDTKSVRKLACTLMDEMAKGQLDDVEVAAGAEESDIRELHWSEQAVAEFAERNGGLIAQACPRAGRQAWIKERGKQGQWMPTAAGLPEADEETFPMWRLPKRENDCAAAASRSVWIGVVPTFSADHGLDPKAKPETKVPVPKLDDHGIYELVCYVRQKPEPGKENCPRATWISAPSEPFRLAAPMDPEGTKNRIVTITAPDLRALAAQAGKPFTGGLRIVTPPRSQFVFNPFKDGKVPQAGEGRLGAGGGVCMFAFELFFIVALFLFLMFLPVVILVFQLWWMLALRLCIPPAAGFGALADAAAGGSLDLNAPGSFRTDLDVALGADAPDPAGGYVINGDAWAAGLANASDGKGTKLAPADVEKLAAAVVTAIDPANASPQPQQNSTEHKVDPLCPRG